MCPRILKKYVSFLPQFSVKAACISEMKACKHCITLSRSSALCRGRYSKEHIVNNFSNELVGVLQPKNSLIDFVRYQKQQIPSKRKGRIPY